MKTFCKVLVVVVGAFIVLGFLATVATENAKHTVEKMSN